MTLLSRKYIDDNDVVARYLADRLSDAERESFEAYYIEHPEMLQEVNRTAQFKSGLIDLRDAGKFGNLSQPAPSWNGARVVAIAASIALLAVIGGIWRGWNIELRPTLAGSVSALSNAFQSTLPVVESYSIQRTRSSSYDATIPLPITPAAIELRIKPKVPAVPATYKVSFGAVTADNSTKDTIAIGGLRTAKDGYITVYMNTANLPPAVYELTIAADDGSSTPDTTRSYLIELVPGGHKR
jgi:hypothetical protein